MSIESFDSSRYKQALRYWTSGVSIIATVDEAGRPAGFTASSFTSVSLSPPLILFCLEETAQSLGAFLSSGYFSVNILQASQQEVSNDFARREGEKFARHRWQPGPQGSPLLANCLARIECQVSSKQKEGDHYIFLGRVLHAECVAGAPLVYFDGGYRALEGSAG